MTTDSAVHIGEAIRARRKDAGMSQAALALAVGVSVRTINGYERGECIPPLDVAGKIADVLDCTTDQLRKGE